MILPTAAELDDRMRDQVLVFGLGGDTGEVRRPSRYDFSETLAALSWFPGDLLVTQVDNEDAVLDDSRYAFELFNEVAARWNEVQTRVQGKRTMIPRLYFVGVKRAEQLEEVGSGIERLLEGSADTLREMWPATSPPGTVGAYARIVDNPDMVRSGSAWVHLQDLALQGDKVGHGGRAVLGYDREKSEGNHYGSLDLVVPHSSLGAVISRTKPEWFSSPQTFLLTPSAKMPDSIVGTRTGLGAVRAVYQAASGQLAVTNLASYQGSHTLARAALAETQG